MRSAEFNEWTSISYYEMPGGVRAWRFYDYEPKGLGKPVFLPDPRTQGKSQRFVEGEPISLNIISNILYYTCGPTRKIAWGASSYTFRAAPSAGALYPYEVYVAANDIKELEKGIYRFHPDSCALEAVRLGGKPIEDILKAAFVDGVIPFAIVITGLVFRSAEKYGDRGYRYTLLDIGHLLLNLSWTASALGLSGTHVLDFDDALANSAIGCDTEFEEVFAIWLPKDVRLNAACICEPKDIAHKYRAIAFHKGTYISRLKQLGRVERERSSTVALPFDVFDAIRKRRSKRDFLLTKLEAKQEALLRKSIERALVEQTSTIVATPKTLILRIPMDENWQVEEFNNKKVIANGKSTKAIVQAALGQHFCAQASFWVLFVADLDRADQSFGARAYRHLLILSGIIGESVYLAANSMGLGACGIGAFADRDLKEALNLPKELSPLYFVCVGQIE